MAARPKKAEKETRFSENPPPVALTKRAIAQLKEAAKREQQPKGVGLRILLIQVANGYRYDIQFEDKELPGDHVSLQGGFKVFVDSLAGGTLQGTQIDYREFPGGEEWGGFIFERDTDDSSST